VKAILILEGPGWGGGNATSIQLGVHPFVRHYSKGDVVNVDCPKGSEEEKEWERRMAANICRVLPGPGTAPKP